jgi:2-C-methyl-D-erythritol 4-phosphate cytidylyltransferase / 2-C-methyl-D-erythritol 2,4-cyclodiphosphate synthase
MTNDIIAIIVAGGTGQRIGGIPKQYRILENGKTVLENAVEPFLLHEKIKKVQVVCDQKLSDSFFKNIVDTSKLLPNILGGITRQESVFKGLQSIASLNPNLVLIHDGARPFVNKNLIDKILLGLERNDVVVPVLEIHDTLYLCYNQKAQKVLDRKNIKTVQTPQGFKFDLINKLHHSYAKSEIFTDDAGLCLKEKIPVATVEGCFKNKKITVSNDLL